MKVTQTSGKRKLAVARATLRPGTGIIRINKVPVQKLRPFIARMKIEELLHVADDEKIKTCNIDVEVTGGGQIGQIDAARIALSRAITKYVNKKRIVRAIRMYDRSMLSGDVRKTEPKKWGGTKARTRFQKSYR